MKSTSIFYYPTTWLWVGDDYMLLNTINFSFSKFNFVKTFQPPKAYLNFLKLFSKCTLVIIDPKAIPESDDYVLVAFTGDTNVTIKKHEADGQHQYPQVFSINLKTILFKSNDG